MKRIITSALALVLTLVAAPLSAAQGADLHLVMFDAPDCGFCAAWERDVGVIYHKTDEGRRAPLLRAHAFSPPPECWSLAAPIEFSPTFVLLQGRQEVARIDGYGGEDAFWGLLEMAIARVPSRSGAPEQAASPAC